MESASVMNILMEVGVLSFVFPVVILLAWRMRTKKTLLPALAGAAVFVLFAKLLEVIPYAVFVGYDNALSRIVRANDVNYAVYQGIVAGIFEQLGRYLSFVVLLKNSRDESQTAITYGIGHGGIEAILSLGIMDIQYYAVALMLQTTTVGADDSILQMQEMINNLTTLDVILEGVSAALFFVMQIALTILVMQAYRNPALRRRLLLIAAVSHALLYIPNGFYNAGLLPHAASVLIQLVIVGIITYFSLTVYRKMVEADKERKKNFKKESPTPQDDGWDVAKKKLTNIKEKDSKHTDE